jgi:hypothetical protein
MKADVLPATAAPRLDIPSWVPEPIAQYVMARYIADVDRVYEKALREDDYLDDDMPSALRDELIHDAVNRANVADLVRDELADITERYLPLTCDSRMERVWWELSRQCNGAFLHPARAPSAANAKERQDAAMLELFDAAFACQRQRSKRRHGARSNSSAIIVSPRPMS